MMQVFYYLAAWLVGFSAVLVVVELRRRFVFGGAPREYALGLGCHEAEREGVLTMSVRPGVDFSPQVLLFHPGTAYDFLLRDVRVDGVSVLRSVGEVPLSAFINYGVPLLECAKGVASTASEVVVVVRNLSCQPREFRGAVVGRSRSRRGRAGPSNSVP